MTCNATGTGHVSMCTRGEGGGVRGKAGAPERLRVLRKAPQPRGCGGAKAWALHPPTSLMGSPPTENPGLRGGGEATRVSGCDEYVQRSCAAHCSGKASAHPFARSIHLDLGPTPVVGECRSHPVTVRMNVGSPATVVLLQRATRRPPPGALRPSSMCPTDCAAIWCMRGAMQAARPGDTSPSAGLTPDAH